MEIPPHAGSGGGKKSGKLSWWQLSLIGVGCIIGTGYFLGSGIGIKMTGPSIILSFLLAGLGTYIVAEALAKMSAKDPQKGAFRSYAKKAFGPWAGFCTGWAFWFSELLITGSQMTALSLLSRFWFEDVPLWIFSSIFAVLGIVVVLIGTKGFEKAQNLFAVIKIAAILMFIVLAITVMFGFFGGNQANIRIPDNTKELFPNGITGLWASLVFGFYAFGGIEIMGILATRLKKRDDAKKAAINTVVLLTIIYIISLILVTSLTALDKFTTKESPFVTALNPYDIHIFPHLFIGGIIIAGFSTMSASLFAVTSMIVTLAKDGDAPKLFSKKGKLKVPPFALFLTIGGVLASIILGLLMPDRVYEYITTAAGLMLLYNWFFVLIAFPRIIKASGFDHVKRFTGMGLILLAISGTLLKDSSRPGFFVSILFIVLIVVVLLIINAVKKRKKGLEPQRT
ncbi:amino acid permease [Siminovitchia sediminis]|uniref:Amino acid permease n=1 Tax=Siminovitchia sediminis TaxID=1274353 RepID=A0ABW4KLR4_9BACI